MRALLPTGDGSARVIRHGRHRAGGLGAVHPLRHRRKPVPSERRRGAAAGAVAMGLVVCAAIAPRLAGEPIVFTQIPVAGSDATNAAASGRDIASELPPGSRIARLNPDDSSAGVTILTPEFAAAGRPDVSFDGRRILFAGRRQPDDPLRMWEMNADGGDVKPIELKGGGPEGKAPDAAVTRLMAGEGDILKAIYLSTIYTIDADEPVYQIGFHSTVDGTPHGSLYTCRMDGTRVRRITFDPNGVSQPFQLSDGRLVFTRWLPAEATGSAQTTGAADLLTVHTDGEDLFPFAAVHEPPAVRSTPCETPDGWVIYVESAVGTPDGGGALVGVRRARSLHSRRVVAPADSGTYLSPFARKDGSLLVSYRDADDPSYGIYVLDPSTGLRTTKLYDDASWHEVDARVLAPRTIPDGRSSVVDDRVDYGQLYCLNAYLSDREEAKAISPGQIQRVRVFRALAGDDVLAPEVPAVTDARAEAPAGELPPPSGGRIPEEVLGEVPVDEDGSFFLEVPAATPLRLETLDGEGHVLQSMQSWVWVMPKGRRGCIGCHEDREMTPSNRHVFALRKRPHRIGLSEPPAPAPRGKARPGQDRGRVKPGE